MKRSQRELFCGCRETGYQRILNVLAPGLLLAAILYLAVIWRTIPAMVPSHYDLSGTADSFGPKQTLWLIPAFGVFSDLVFALLWRFPQLWNIGVPGLTLTPRNRAYVYTVVRDMMAEVRVELALMFAPVAPLMARGKGGSPVWLAIALTAVTIVRALFRLRLARRIG